MAASGRGCMWVPLVTLRAAEVCRYWMRYPIHLQFRGNTRNPIARGCDARKQGTERETGRYCQKIKPREELTPVANSKGSNCLFFKWVVTAVWLWRDIPANTKHLYKIYTMLDQRCRNVIQMFSVCWDAASLGNCFFSGSSFFGLRQKAAIAHFSSKPLPPSGLKSSAAPLEIVFLTKVVSSATKSENDNNTRSMRVSSEGSAPARGSPSLWIRISSCIELLRGIAVCKPGTIRNQDMPSNGN